MYLRYTLSVKGRPVSRSIQHRKGQQGQPYKVAIALLQPHDVGCWTPQAQTTFLVDSKVWERGIYS